MLERLDDAFTSQERFAANASHELRTPLAVTATMLDVARGGEEDSELLRRLQVTNARAIGLTEALLRLADANAVTAAFEPVDLAQLVRDAGVDGELAPTIVHGGSGPARAAGREPRRQRRPARDRRHPQYSTSDARAHRERRPGDPASGAVGEAVPAWERADRRRRARAWGSRSSPASPRSTAARSPSPGAKGTRVRRDGQPLPSASRSLILPSSCAMTSGSRSVVTSPSSRPSAMSRSSRRMILPERVLGRSSAQMMRFGRANLPIRAATLLADLGDRASSVAVEVALERDERGDRLARVLVGLADHGGLGDLGVRDDRGLDLGGATAGGRRRSRRRRCAR